MNVYPHRELDGVDRQRLGTCHQDLVTLFLSVAEVIPIRVVCGFRGMAEQEEAVRSGTSTLHYPHSRHNTLPSEAVDVAPMLPVPDEPGHWYIDWSDLRQWHVLADVVKATAERLGISVEWGGDWKGFRDFPHWQVPRKQ